MGKTSKKKTKGEVSKDTTQELTDPNEPTIYTSIRAATLISFDWLFVFIGCVASLGAGTIGALFVLSVGKLTDVIAPSNSFEPSDSPVVRAAAQIFTGAMFNAKLREISIELGIYTIIGSVLNIAANWAFIVSNDRVGMRLRNAYFSALVKQEIGFFDITKSGKIVNNLTEDITTIQEVLSLKLGKFCEFASQCIIAIILAFKTSWQLTIVVFAASPGLLIPLLGAAGFAELFKRLDTSSASMLLSIVNEVVGGMRTVRSMSGEEKETKKYSKLLLKGNVVSIFKSVSIGITSGLVYSALWGIIMLAFWYGGKLVHDETITIGQLVLVASMLLFGVLGSAQAILIIPEFTKANTAAISLLKVILREPMIRFKGGITPDQLTGNIEFKNIVFRYPSRPDVAVLKNFSLSVRAGQNVALVGQSGSGKSTIVGLLERFYEAESGDVLIDGIDLKEIDPQWLHKHIGIVTQEPTLFATTIKKNITYAVSEYRKVTDEEIIEAAKAANAHDFISSLPDGYNTMLGERGVSLSGGQKQRIAIARAMIQNPSVLLLDEATSALDTESESLVQDALSRLMQGRTSIVIAHRLSTVQNSDVIVVMTRGEIVEMGKHSDLVAIPNGVYAKLAAKQMKFGDATEDTSDIEDEFGSSDKLILSDSISNIDEIVIDLSNNNQQQQQQAQEEQEEEIEQSTNYEQQQISVEEDTTQP